jgi:hypothetical protein
VNYHAHLEESLTLADKTTAEFEDSKQKLDGYLSNIAELESRLAESEAAMQHAKLDRNLSSTEATKQVVRIGAEMSVLQARIEQAKADVARQYPVALDHAISAATHLDDAYGTYVWIAKQESERILEELFEGAPPVLRQLAGETKRVKDANSVVSILSTRHWRPDTSIETKVAYYAPLRERLTQLQQAVNGKN